MIRRRPPGPFTSRRVSGQSASETLVVLAILVAVFLAGRPNLPTRLIQMLHRVHQEFLTLIALP